MDPGIADEWRCDTSQTHAECRVYNILRERWRNLRTEAAADFYVMQVRDWAVAIGLTAGGACVLVRQFRFGSGAFSLELPAGLVDAGEDPATAAARELYEESGYAGGKVTRIGVLEPNPAIQRNRCHVYLVAGVERVGAGRPDAHESFRVETYPLTEVYAMACDGRISHAIVPAALFLLRSHLERND